VFVQFTVRPEDASATTVRATTPGRPPQHDERTWTLHATESRSRVRILSAVIEEVLHRRTQYETRGIDVTDVDPDPYRQFERWFDDAARDIGDANAMVLSTAGPAGPSSRAVLLRDITEGAFVFYTNRRSRKGQDIEVDPRVSLLFPWFPLHRQVRIEGVVEPVADELSDAYFRSRPRESRAGAVASPQSERIPSRAWLEERAAQILELDTIDRPDHWGGYGVTPFTFEFWQGRPNRLHDRIRYTRADERWVIERLAP
jgi:pyridoxamine 5'-phosphate oxidase